MKIGPRHDKTRNEPEFRLSASFGRILGAIIVKNKHHTNGEQISEEIWPLLNETAIRRKDREREGESSRGKCRLLPYRRPPTIKNDPKQKKGQSHE